MPASPLPLLLLTRPHAQSLRFAETCRATCPPHEALIAPLTEIVALPFDAKALAQAAGLVITSPNAVAALGGMAPRPGMLAWCVGPGSAAAARAAGFSVQQSGGDAAHLIADLRRTRPDGPLVHLHGRHLARDLVSELRAKGLAISGVVAYAAEARDWSPDERAQLSEALAKRRVIAPLFSPRAARELAHRLPSEPSPGLVLVAISANCAAALPQAWQHRVTIAARPDAEAMLAAIGAGMSQPRPQP